MRILMITSEFPPKCGGIGWYVYYLSKEMKSRGNDVTIVQRTSNKPEKFGPWQIYPINAGIFPLFNAFYMVGKLRAFLRKRPHDVAIVHGTPLGAWLQDIPTILLSHSLFAEARKSIYKGGRDLYSLLHVFFSGLYIEAERHSINGADTVAVVSHAMKEEIRRHYGKDTLYIGNAVDTANFFKTDGINSRGVLLPSHLRPGKGVPETIQIMKRIRNRGCDIPFRFINMGSMKNTLIKGIKKFSLTNVELLDPVDHSKLRELYHNSSTVFLPSSYEGLPNVCLEASSSGLPIVATDAGGTREVVIHGETGFIHDLTDIEGIADSIMKLDVDPLLRKTFGMRGRKLVTEEYTWQKVGDRFEQLFTQIS
jgi:glycosyltransferase involved in cell wall biosynthesis